MEKPRGLLPYNDVMTEPQARRMLRSLLEMTEEKRTQAIATLTHRQCNCLCHWAGIARIKGGPRKQLLRRLNRLIAYSKGALLERWRCTVCTKHDACAHSPVVCPRCGAEVVLEDIYTSNASQEVINGILGKD